MKSDHLDALPTALTWVHPLPMASPVTAGIGCACDPIALHWELVVTTPGRGFAVTGRGVWSPSRSVPLCELSPGDGDERGKVCGAVQPPSITPSWRHPASITNHLQIPAVSLGFPGHLSHALRTRPAQTLPGACPAVALLMDLGLQVGQLGFWLSWLGMHRSPCANVRVKQLPAPSRCH